MSSLPDEPKAEGKHQKMRRPLSICRCVVLMYVQLATQEELAKATM
jgi:hypothetical protein